MKGREEFLPRTQGRALFIPIFVPPAEVCSRGRKRQHLHPPAHLPCVHTRVHTHTCLPASLPPCLFLPTSPCPQTSSPCPAHLCPHTSTPRSCTLAHTPAAPQPHLRGAPCPPWPTTHSDAHPTPDPLTWASPLYPLALTQKGFLTCFAAPEPQKCDET